MSAIAVSVRAPQSGWRKLIGFNMLTGVLLGIGGWFLGHFIGGRFTGADIAYYADAGQNDIAIFLGYFLGVVGFLIGMGFANYPLKRLLGHPPALAEHEAEAEGVLRYFTMSTDHKVVAKQYMVGIGLFFFVAGLNAMLIRTELLQPNVHVFGANQYLTLVGLHGSMMMGTMTSGLLGPFAQWLIPLMIGSRRMAFPRVEAFSFWLLMAGEVILITTIFFGGFQTGWTGYQPLGAQGTAGYDAYIGFFALVGLSMCLFGFNNIVTIITMRARGMTWSRLPIFVLGGVRDLVADDAGGADADRRVADGGDGPDDPDHLLRARSGRQRLPVPEPVLGVRTPGGLHPGAPRDGDRARDHARCSAANRCGATGWPSRGCSASRFLSWFVWQHHLFVSGINADLRPFYMLSTELISLPTGFIFLCAMGTMWRGRIRLSGADAVLPGLDVQLPVGRDLRRVQLRRAE